MLCFRSNKNLYICDATVFLNVYSCLVFLGECLALVPSHLPHLRKLGLQACHRICDKYVDELVTAVPELEFIGFGCIVEPVRNKELKAT
jgi:hypothetical protein